jgi:phosphoserine phosphatase RsbU/P
LRRFLLLALLLVVGFAPHFACAESAASRSTVVRYHFGDNAAWALPSFNDSGWSFAQDGKWPGPSYYSSGFMWVRFEVRVRGDAAEPLALRVENSGTAEAAEEVFVNGRRVGTYGRFPPHPQADVSPKDVIFDIPAGLTRPGAVASIALRLWYPPLLRGTGTLYAVTCTFDQRRTLDAEQATVRAQTLLHYLPALMLNGIILLMGCIVLLLARSSRSRDLFLYGAMLASIPLISLFREIVGARLVSLSTQQYPTLQALSQLPAMIVTVAFIWGVNDLRDVWVKRVALAAIGIANFGLIYAYAGTHPSAMSAIAGVTSGIAIQAFDVIVIGASLWILFFVRRNRLVAFALALPALGSLIAGFFHAGQDVFNLASFLSGLFLSFALALNAWKEWRANEALRTEFEAAREVQQQLVAPPVDIPGFRIESVYVPATHLGGDFFRVVPEGDGSVLVVVGDVSGKGLKAALTVSAVIGALRTMPQLGPARVLAALNRGLVGQMQYGFATCLCARITPNGTMTVANAGHLSPYRNGDEIELDSGLPLGIAEAAEYSETTVQLEAGDRLMFLSDGVIEARSASGELFGFERTREISGKSAEEIAQRAQEFGQEDDITVLTLRLAGA